MFLRVFALLLIAAATAGAQVALSDSLPIGRDANGNRLPVLSAWLDLRQTSAANAKTQSAPRWVESVTLVPVAAQKEVAAQTIFRIRVAHPDGDLPLLLLRLFFDDKPEQRPSIVVWDESGSQVLRSKALGGGIDLPTSDTVLLPMVGGSCIDIEVPGDGTTVRGVFMDWMTSRNVAHPLSAQQRDIVPEPFAAAAPIRLSEFDSETFGTVTAPLSAETIRIGPAVQQGAAFQFGIEAQPLMALLEFEVSAARMDSPPEVYVNGENLGPASLTYPGLADPAYRGEKERLIKPMSFRYTGWLRAQKLVPADRLRAGVNDVIVVGGGAEAAAIRATQIQLKYLWDKSDYLLDPK